MDIPKKRATWMQNEFAMLGILIVVMLLLMGILSPSRFFSVTNLQSMAFQIPELGLLSLAMMLVMLTGGINLSIVASANLAGIIMALVLNAMAPPEIYAGNGIGITFIVILVGLTVGFLIGLANGALVAYVGVSPILATLGMMTFLNGVSILITKGYVISGFPPAFQFLGNGKLLGLPFPFIVFALIALLAAYIMKRTPFGVEVYMLGTNETATRYSAVNVSGVLMRTYIASGILTSLAAIVMISRFNSAKSDYGESYLLVTILAAVLGGTDVDGGFGKVTGLVLALVILQIIGSGLNLLQVNAFLTRAIWGLILAAVMIGHYYRAKTAARMY